MITIDGAAGEGGGQILRTALSLSMLRGVPVRIERIRAGRGKPGLLRQHLAAVHAAASVCGAKVDGAALGSKAISFAPGALRGGRHLIDIGSAGSTTLVLQTLLPALLAAPAVSEVEITGGTHNPLAPSFEFLARSFVPVLQAQGAQLELELLRHGFAPAGGGRLRLRVQPSALRPLDLVERGPLRGIGAEVLLASLPRHVGERELDQVRERFAPGDAALKLHQLGNQHPPANLLTLYAHCGRHCETVIAHGALGKRAEAVGQAACAELAAYLDSGAAVGEHLADQLLLPALLGGGGSYTTHVASSHLRSNAHTLEQMGVAEVSIDPCAGGNWRIEVRPG